MSFAIYPMGGGSSSGAIGKFSQAVIVGVTDASTTDATAKDASTVDATPTALAAAAITPTDNSAGIIYVDFEGVRSDGAVLFIAHVKAPYTKIAGVLTLGTVTTSIYPEEQIGAVAGMNASLTAAGGVATPVATGLAGTTFRWGTASEIDLRTTVA